MVSRHRATFSADDSPLHEPAAKQPPADATTSYASATDSKATAVAATTLAAFDEATGSGFAAFLDALRSCEHFDLTLLSKLWCQHLAQYWDRTVPGELLDIFATLYRYHLRHFEAATWSHLEATDFRSVFRMSLWWLELQHDRAEQQPKQRQQQQQPLDGGDDGDGVRVDAKWLDVFEQLLFHTGFYETGTAADERTLAGYQVRWRWLQYLQARYENRLQLAVDYLYATDECLQAAAADADDADDAGIRLPNQRRNEHISRTAIGELCAALERSIHLNSVPQLYRDGEFARIVPILCDSLRAIDWRTDPLAGGQTEAAGAMLPTTQLEVLLEAFYQLDCWDECMRWTEHTLGYAWLHFGRAPAETARHARWAALVTFALTYARALIGEESVAIVERLGARWAARFVQTVGRVVVDQLDGPIERGGGGGGSGGSGVRTHAVCTRLPWLLLHAVIQREEDVQWARCRRAAAAAAAVAASDGGDERAALALVDENGVPMSVMVFFTAHEFLGARSWCTLQSGAFLLHVMDVVADALRTPALDRHRDVVGEYLEQVTYCLYGYPARRARARHIEEHDACNVELTWPRAVQLFDLYRPEALPEFNSYK